MRGRDLLKLAEMKTAAPGVGAALRYSARAAGRGARNVVSAASQFGAGVAEGVGVAPEIGQIAGGGLAVAAGASAAGRAKRKVDEWRYRNGLYTQY